MEHELKALLQLEGALFAAIADQDGLPVFWTGNESHIDGDALLAQCAMIAKFWAFPNPSPVEEKNLLEELIIRDKNRQIVVKPFGSGEYFLIFAMTSQANLGKCRYLLRCQLSEIQRRMAQL